MAHCLEVFLLFDSFPIWNTPDRILMNSELLSLFNAAWLVGTKPLLL